MAVSDQLTKLAARAKEAEDRAAAAQGKASADLEKDVEAARTSAQAQADKLRATAEEKKGKLSVWWYDVQRSWDEHIERIRTDIDSRRAEHDRARADERRQRGIRCRVRGRLRVRGDRGGRVRSPRRDTRENAR